MAGSENSRVNILFLYLLFAFTPIYDAEVYFCFTETEKKLKDFHMAVPPHVCGNVCQILVFEGLPVVKYALRRAAQSFDPDIRRAAIKSSRKTVTVKATAVESGEGVCASRRGACLYTGRHTGKGLGIHLLKKLSLYRGGRSLRL
jgi:hypothetical protein